MATLKCLLQSEKETANIYIQFSISKRKVLKRKTGYTINQKDWNNEKGNPTQKNEASKFLKSSLDRLKVFINDAFNIAVSNGKEIDGVWLQYQINLFHNKVEIIDLDILTNSIDNYINKKDKLSKGSIKNLENLKKAIINYQNSHNSKRHFLIRDIDLKFIADFTEYFKARGSSINYIGTYISMIKAIINYASSTGIQINKEFSQIKSIRKIKEPDEIKTLSVYEQKQIREVELTREAHKNARKWILLGCLIGQRAGDLLKITLNNIKDLGDLKIIELKQEKTEKTVAIPLVPDAIKIIESGMPYRISLEHLNCYSKEICKIAQINTIVKGKMRINGKRTLTAGNYEKWQVISSHDFRRSFATNFYGKIPTPVLINITAHSSESLFMRYIGKTTYENAYQFMDYFEKLKN
ncbi:phage integrase SAM-like domain-containing protein [Flavobacterium psychrophilum]|nr:site-specific integrase [Flavobacterium psychrophilum]EKT4535621.1 site-specific integrase [Flavobacterium psychrophilum]